MWSGWLRKVFRVELGKVYQGAFLECIFTLASHSPRGEMWPNKTSLLWISPELRGEKLDLLGSQRAAHPSLILQEWPVWTFLVCVNIFRFAQKNNCLQKSCLLLLCFGTKIQDYNEVPLKIWISWSIMSEWSWNSPEWQFASFLFALPSQWSRKAVHSTVNLVQPTAAQPCWFIGAIHWEMLHLSGSGSAHQFHVDFYSCPWMVKGFGYHNQIFALLSSVWCCTPSAVLARVWGHAEETWVESS